MRACLLAVAITLVTITTNYQHACAVTCSDLFNPLEKIPPADSSVVVSAGPRSYREPSASPMVGDAKTLFLRSAASGAYKKNNQLINLAWAKNEAGFLMESKSVDDYLKIFAEDFKKGRDFDVKDEAGRTPLMHAAITGYLNMQTALLKVGARVDLLDHDGRSAADLAGMMVPDGVTANLYYVEKFLSYQGYYIGDAVFDAFKRRDFKLLQSLFDRGVYVDIFDLDLGQSQLTHAVAENDLELAEFLLRNGADPNFRMRGGTTGKVYPVLTAAGAGRIEAVALLMRYGGDINSTGVYSFETNSVRQALWNAAREANPLEPHLKMLDWLLDHGANPDFFRTPVGYRKPLPLKNFVEEELFPSWQMDTKGQLKTRKAAIVAVLRHHGFW